MFDQGWRVSWYGTPQFLPRSTVRYAFLVIVRYGTLVRCMNMPTKRFMCNVQPLMKIRAAVLGVQIV